MKLIYPSNRNWTDDQQIYSLSLYQLSYTRDMRRLGIEPRAKEWKSSMLPLHKRRDWNKSFTHNIAYYYLFKLFYT